VVNTDKPAFFLEFLLQVRAFPFEGEKGLLDLGRDFRMEIVRVAVTGGREGG
jgi:hypothetical protein